jgi:HAD superfamily hydrolase (TIGR01509 family)
MSKEYIEFLRKLPVFECFDAQVISSEVRLGKPDRRFYEYLLTHCELNPAETIFIDDRLDNVEAAEELGIVPFHFALNDPEGSCEALRKVIYNK